MSSCYNEVFYQKVKNEYEVFLKELVKRPPEQIVEGSYEKVYKEELVSILETSSFSEKEAALLCAVDHPLDALYQEWLDNEYSCVGFLEDTISQFVSGLLNEEGSCDGA